MSFVDLIVGNCDARYRCATHADEKGVSAS